MDHRLEAGATLFQRPDGVCQVVVRRLAVIVVDAVIDLELSIEAAVVNGFQHVVGGNVFPSGQIGDGSTHAEDFVMGAGR